MEYQSCFDIIGPIMVGPSSSHTAGVVSIGKFIHEVLGGCPEKAIITFYDSFSETYHGHGTDKAIIGGLLGMNPDDSRIKYAINLADPHGLDYEFKFEESCPYFDHPNTTIVTALREDISIKIGGVSLGGGLSKIFMINDEKTDIRLAASGESSELAVKYRFNPGTKSDGEGLG